jgi:hypothetical protein
MTMVFRTQGFIAGKIWRVRAISPDLGMNF